MILDRLRKIIFQKTVFDDERELEDYCLDLIGSRDEKPVLLYGGLCKMVAGEIMINVAVTTMSFLWVNSRSGYWIIAVVFGEIYPKYLFFRIDYFKFGFYIVKRPLMFHRDSHIPLKKLGLKTMNIRFNS